MAAPQVFDRTSQGFLLDPYPHYGRLRETEPIHWSEPSGSWTFFRHGDVSELLKDDEHLSAAQAGSRSMLSTDPPVHTRLRSFATRAFTPKAVRAWRPRIETLIEELLQSMDTGSAIDAVEQFAYPLPLTVIAELLGVELEHRVFFRDASRRIAVALGPISDAAVAMQAIQARNELIQYFSGLIERKRHDPADDLLSTLIATQPEENGITTDELLDMLVLLLVGGHETTVNLIANGLLALLRHPEAMEAMRSGEIAEERAVEEFLRFDSPVQYTGRLARKDFEFGGHRIGEGSPVRLCLASANRDPEKFADPDMLMLDRDPNPHLAFGAGVHYCLGAQLARMEGRLAITAIIRRFPAMRLGEGALRYRPATVLRGLESLPIVLA